MATQLASAPEVEMVLGPDLARLAIHTRPTNPSMRRGVARDEMSHMRHLRRPDRAARRVSNKASVPMKKRNRWSVGMCLSEDELSLLEWLNARGRGRNQECLTGDHGRGSFPEQPAMEVEGSEAAVTRHYRGQDEGHQLGTDVVSPVSLGP